jgi:PAS domain S-box-containing protein
VSGAALEAASQLSELTAVEQSAALALLRGTSHVSALLEADGIVRWISPSITKVLGYERDEFVGENIVSFLHPEDLEVALGLLEFGAANEFDGALDRDDISAAVDFRVRHRDGHWVAMEVMLNNFLATPGIGASLTIAMEATGRRAFDEALIALAQDWTGDEALLRLLAFLEVRISDSDTALFWSEGSTPWTTQRVPAALLVSEGPWVDALKRGEYVIIPDLSEGVTQDVISDNLAQTAIDAGYVACWCVPVPAPRHPESLWIASPRLDEREPLGAIVFWSKAQREPLLGHLGTIERVAALAYLALSRRVADMERSARLEMEREQVLRLQELDAMKTDLVLSVSHELRTPLTSIISFAELLDEQPQTYDAEESAQYLAIIKRNAQRLLRTVGDLLFLGRLESGISPLTVGPVDVSEVIRGAVEDVRPAAEGKDVTVDLDSSPGCPLSGDVERVRQLVDNLLSNAVKYTEPSGRVQVATHPLTDGWQLTVADNGIGIPAGEVEQVFDRFYRCSNAREAQIAGSGLGLVIAEAVAKLHHGSIDLLPTEGGGSTFVVTLHDA